jgi:hypothetical protein
VTGIVRGKTLVEKAYGPGFRDTPHMQAVAPWPGCGYEGCGDPFFGKHELYVDDPPPALDAYTRMLSKLPAHTWTWVSFCKGHFDDVSLRSGGELWDNPDLWAPWRASPPVLMHPPKLITPKGA